MKLAALLVMAGLMVTGFASYLVFPHGFTVPVLDSGDWPKLMVFFLGAAWAVFGTTQAFRLGKSRRAKMLLLAPLLLTLGTAGFMSYYVLSYTQQLPAPSEQAEGESLPAFKLVDHEGKPFSSESLAGRRHIITFYRGAW